MKKKFWLYILVFLAIILRVILASLPSFKIDADSFFAWALRLADLGPTHFYSKDVFTDYTPGYLYVLFLLGLINKIFSFTGEQFYLLLKIPSILAEVAIGIFVFIICEQKKLSTKNSLLLSSLIFF